MSIFQSIINKIQTLSGKIRSKIIYDYLYFLRKKQLKQFFEPEIHSWDLIFDIGGHLGDKTRFFHNYPLKIVIIEPHPYYFKKLQIRFSNNSNITIVNKGISDTDSELLFYPSTTHPSVSTFNQQMVEKIGTNSRWKNVKWTDPIEIEMTTLQNLIDDYGIPDFVKIDVEGFEDKVIKTLKQPLPFLSFEFLPAFPNPGLNTLVYLKNLDEYMFIFVAKEAYNKSEKWSSFSEIFDFLSKYNGPSGNVFAKLQKK